MTVIGAVADEKSRAVAVTSDAEAEVEQVEEMIWLERVPRTRLSRWEAIDVLFTRAEKKKRRRSTYQRECKVDEKFIALALSQV